jgi:hypothetical protein
MTDSTDAVHLSRDVALVLFELLSRGARDGSIRPVDSAEQRALGDLEAALERILPEPFLPNYAELLEHARRRLRAPNEQPTTSNPLVAFVDVDETLVRSAGSKRVPISEMIKRVRELREIGVELYCWSSGGAKYARETAVELGIGDCFVGFLPKPGVMIDDQAPADWRNLLCLHPNEASSMSATEIQAATGRRGG